MFARISALSVVPLVALFPLSACSVAGQSGIDPDVDPEAREAFAAYEQCLADVAAAVVAGNAAPAVNGCYGEDLARDLLDNLDMFKERLSNPPTDAKLVGHGQTEGTYDGVELHVLETLYGQLGGARVTMAASGDAWLIAQVRYLHHPDALASPPDGPPIETEVHVDGELVLSDELGVWTTTNAGYPILSFTPWFDGPELQIDNLTARSPSQVLDSNYQGDFSNTPDRVQVRFRDETVNSSWDLRGTLTVDDVTEGRMSGNLQLQLRTLVEGPVEVDVRFANLPVP